MIPTHETLFHLLIGLATSLSHIRRYYNPFLFLYFSFLILVISNFIIIYYYFFIDRYTRVIGCQQKGQHFLAMDSTLLNSTQLKVNFVHLSFSFTF